jgi:hypothetical protein
MLSDSQIPAPRVPITEKEGGIITREWFRFFNFVYEQVLQITPYVPPDPVVPLKYGSFYGSTSPTWASNTVTLVPIESTTTSSGVTNASSIFTVSTAGVYDLTATLQLTTTDLYYDENAVFWLRVNGADAASTAKRISITPSYYTSGLPLYAVITLNFQRQFAAGDTFSLYGLSVGGYVQLVSTAASSSPAYPAAPCAVLTVAQIA